MSEVFPETVLTLLYGCLFFFQTTTVERGGQELCGCQHEEGNRTEMLNVYLICLCAVFRFLSKCYIYGCEMQLMT